MTGPGHSPPAPRRDDPSGFRVGAAQRRRLLEGDYGPLDFDDRPELEPGDRCVLLWAKGQPERVPGYGIRALPVPLVYITVSGVQRHRKGFWRVRFDVTDNRDRDVFLRRGGGYTGFDELQAGAVPDREWLAVRAKAISERDHLERLKRHAEQRRERSRDRLRRAA